MADRVPPLDGVRIVDLSRLLPGAYCTWLLAALGADIIKVEDPRRGDYLRDFGPQHPGGGALHHQLNAGKRSVVIDLKAPSGIDALGELLAGADVLVDSFRPGVLERLGIDGTFLRGVRPDLVHASITGYGLTGPMADAPGHDLNYMAIAGALGDLTELVPGERARLPRAPLADVVGGGLIAALAITAQLVSPRRALTRLDLAATEGIALLPHQRALDELNDDDDCEAPDFMSGAYACYRVYPVVDGHVTVAAVEPAFWRALCESLELVDVVDAQLDPARQEELADRLGTALGAMTRSACADVLGPSACVAPVWSTAELAASTLADARELTARGAADLRLLAAPFVADGRRRSVVGDAPLRGQHTREVFEERGTDPLVLQGWLEAGVVREVS
jgi:crotonobetainyl-CoA:carnitine CoA-transferase CaiB-like acyl-CoA transferase